MTRSLRLRRTVRALFWGSITLASAAWMLHSIVTY